MPRRRLATLAGIALLFGVALAFASLYGPSRRVFAAQARVVEAASPAALVSAWAESGVRGRVAVLFTRYLNATAAREVPDPPVTEKAIEHAILRRVYHVLPDDAWPEVDRTLAAREDMRPTPEGYVWMYLDVRVLILPRSRFVPFEEPALVVVEPGVWSPEALRSIEALVRSRAIATDQLVVLRGSDEALGAFRLALAGGSPPGG